MFKKCLALVIAFALCFSFAGCVSKPKEYAESDHRWYTDFTDTLIPRDDYGELVVFIGGYKEDMDYYGYRYGLMTLDGKVVIDPVYNRYCTMELNGTEYYCMQYTENELYEGGEYYCRSTLMRTDGSWAITLEGDISCISENRIITSMYSEHFKVYDYEGNLIFAGNDNQSIDTNGKGFYNGLLVAFDFSVDNGDIVYDENGNVVFDGLAYCGPFVTGKAVASYNREEGYGVISSEGKWLLDSVYDEIDVVEDGQYFVATVGGIEEIYDSNLKLLHSREWSGDYRDDSYFSIYGDRLHKYYSNADGPDEYYRDAFTDEIVSCKENGLPATKLIETDDENNPLFSAVDESGKLWVFDSKGEIYRSFENGGMFEFIPGGFYCVGSGDYTEGTNTYFNAKTHEKIFSAYTSVDQANPVTLLSVDCPYLSVGDLEYIGENRYVGKYHLYNYETEEYVFKDCDACFLEKVKEKTYITIIYSDKISIYDENLNLVLQVKN
ncbi:MAG: WG repeat-containing protein, partial [Clostridia bacterium]|nr:WG repeat-containing protein [Clostridia bacterium]